MIEILASGPLTTVQDLGRFGWTHVGVSQSGAADLGAHRLANRLVGNTEDLATLELTLGGLTARFDRATEIALTGARCPVWLDGRTTDLYSPLMVRAGQVLHVGTPLHRLRTYLAVRGGIDVEPVLGSRSTDIRTTIGPPPVYAGQRLPIGEPVSQGPGVEVAPQPRVTGVVELQFLPGPRVDWFADDALDVLTGSTYTVSHLNNRIGTLLDGPRIERARPDELPHDPVLRGAIEVSAHGQPTIMFADHPVTAAYPVIGALLPADADVAAQTMPGRSVRLVPVTRPLRPAGVALQAEGHPEGR